MSTEETERNEQNERSDFIRDIINDDMTTHRWGGRVHTRFPPEPNGYLHIGHAKSICLNFGVAAEYGGKCNLRFDDTNPTREEQEYIDSIIEDVKWLGFDWEERLLYSSDYFEQMYQHAVELVNSGKAYVDDLTGDQIREYRGDVTIPGRNSPHRDRPPAENLDLFTRMRNGEFPDGTRVLRAKIDMTHPNMNMRDPVMYRILHESHPHTGDAWCIYPMYDWAHGLEDSIEGITHSLCTLEFENHRPLYDWFINAINDARTSAGEEPIHHPQQTEFARLNMTYTVMSKRKLLELVEENHVSGWDDPRMPTIGGMRRRGYPPEAIREFLSRVGVAKVNSTIDFSLLESVVREVLNKTAPRYMGVLRPLKVVIENFQENETEFVTAVNNPEDPTAGTRKIPFSREFYIEQEDFMEDPPKKFFRLSKGREVRLRYAYFFTCTDVVKSDGTQMDADGNLIPEGVAIELRGTIDPATKGGDSPDGRRVKATLHWVSAPHALNAEVRLFDRLFTVENPLGEKGNFPDYINPESLKTLTACKVEPSVGVLGTGDRFQFERLGYFCIDTDASGENRIIINRTVGLRDSWAKLQNQQKGKKGKQGEGKKSAEKGK
jgi:glutaminyl-tRNA synthetase